jgi:para-aminobenzoate synthetase/4-amino-4-deoxychorismate lyase
VSDGIRRALVRAEPGSERFLRFDRPVEVLVAQAANEVPALLALVEQGTARGLWAVGFVGYEAAPAFDRALAVHAPSGGPIPLAAFSLFEAPEETPGLSMEEEASVAGRAPAIDEVRHAAAIAAIRAAIAQGDTYQVNFVFPFSGSFSGRAQDLFAGLLAPGEAPYAALLEGDAWAIASLSPELFFERNGDRVVMRPMKGTRPRGRFLAEDAPRAAELAASEKDRAENLMIVDMVRNDLGRVARAGTVVVEERLAVERYPTVWQMTSTVAAESAARLPELFAALFPCASITGAPKAATMRIIRELEPAPRGVYCGAVGFVAPSGRARFAVAIRTLELDTSAATYRYGVGSGVTWDSNAAEEWRECLAKARVLDGAPPDFELLETMRWHPGRGIELLALHLERLGVSSEYFGFEGRKASIEGELSAELMRVCAALPPRSHRVRLRLARSGEFRIETDPFEEGQRAWTLDVSGQSFSSLDVIAFHKTTFRQRYETALAGAPAGLDEVLLVNEHGELTEGTRTNLFLQFDGGWVTPPRESGLLAGVFRESLLRSRQVSEATLYPRDLARAHLVRLGNALRGWIPVAATRRSADR